ncbi:DNA-3-methyladenine glycosylase [uncultured Dialister sp.]|uniref:DNA-3-methyladenine glycosylase n=1 Tax=uncultured Dialister sp. TaxID=278064 RepID=UPI0025D94810|nr:DNA-3-methyladenine glycosylase [uncultured Dialister sp.]
MKWQREDYLSDAVRVAQNLIGKILVRKSPEGLTAGRIVEAEAYGEIYKGHKDDGAHVFKGLTPRTKVIFGEGGHAYIYLIYGMYSCLNIVCGHEGETGSVLIRALEPLEGIDLMKKRRRQEKLKLLTSGPGRLTMAMAIDKSFYGLDLTGDTLYVEDRNDGPFEIEVTKRINIDYAVYGKDFPWRFTLKGSPYVTKNPFPTK